jgi:uncharacterized iron-regulated membrane protein
MNFPDSAAAGARTGPGSSGLRQSMAWLHTWAGLLVGWVLFFMFVTGTFGYVNAEVDRWMKPELPQPAPPPPAAELLPAAEARLRAVAPDAESWAIYFPGTRGSDQLSIAWRARPPAAAGPGAEGEEQREALELASGEPVQRQVRETGGGGTLYRMHYSLHYLPESWASYIVGLCALFMLVAMVSGVVVHKKFFTDFFTFRPGKGQRSWLDGHNLLSVSALPFHLMITWSGLIFYLFTYMPAPLAVLYSSDAAQQRFEQEAYGYEHEETGRNAALAPLVPLSRVLAQTEAKWGRGFSVWSLEIANPGRADARISTWSYRPSVIGSSWAELRLDGVTGKVLGATDPERSAVDTFRHTLFNLHEGHFSTPLLRLLYVLSALAATAMIGTGLLLWSSKRKAKLRPGQAPSSGLLAVDVLNAGTLVGLPIGVAAYFWANRLLPVGLEGRADWEMNALFLTWALTFAVAFCRVRAGLWRELCWVAAGAYGALPIVNALTTDRHLGTTLAAGDWVLAGFDLCALGLGLFFGFLARSATGRASAAARAPARQPTSVPAAEVA